MPLNNPFLKATPLYKEYAILELLSKNSNITQRAIAKELDSSLSMINQYLEEYEKKELIKRKYINGKSVEYYLTKKGTTRLRELNIKYLENVRNIYIEAKEHIVKYLNQIIRSGYTKVFMYGAGEVAELTLQVIEEEKPNLEILGIIDDDKQKQGEKIMGKTVYALSAVSACNFDGILISSYTHSKSIKEKLIRLGYKFEIIFDYFE